MIEFKEILNKIDCSEEDRERAYNDLCYLFGVGIDDLKPGDEIILQSKDGEVFSEAVVMSEPEIKHVTVEVEYKHNGFTDWISSWNWTKK